MTVVNPGIGFVLLLVASAGQVGCSSSGASADAGVEAAPISCGASVDCPDAQMCAYPVVKNGCSLVGQCRVLPLPADSPSCAGPTPACPCSGETQDIPACWGDYSPFAVLNVGQCPGDGG